ncbi:uncharacterized protein FOMMEDRAFT_149063 [Fomitiporia mediterranea MF3/22]|uniref:uncharacterized protein n=1 Tax=Fomitiporia mediterranea (strain MF3/22) TaxID=694068 RepID=UPI00044093FA|nr:uncharacterized protein FOMMEDRAFT_149063 [Fomitiporia mediterranea MF3/22]EJC98690.1 hypothetical protein FOMMEDRAFT_149063 [Fomitiporia mediterranea MF3/22]
MVMREDELGRIKECALAFSLWAMRRNVRTAVIYLPGRVGQRLISSRILPIELRETISPELTKDLAGLHNAVKAAIGKSNADELCYNLASSRRVFFTLPRTAWQHIRETYLHLTGQEVEQIAGLLAGRCKKDDAETLGQLLRDLKAMYGVDATSELLLTSLDALIRSGQHLNAYELLQLFHSYKRKLFRPNAQHWQTVMQGLALIGDVERLKQCLSIMKGSWPFPGNSHYQALFEGLYRTGDAPLASELTQVLDEMQKFCLPYDDGVHSILLKLAERHRLYSLPTDYRTKCVAQCRPTEEDIESWLMQLVVYRKRAKLSFETKLNHFRHKGFVPDESSLLKLVQMMSLCSPEELTYLQETMEVAPKSIVWTTCIQNALDKTGWRSALAAYNTAKSHGVRPDAAMVHPLLREMCNNRFKEPPEAVLDQALELYNDLKGNAKSNWKLGPDTGIFNTLLRALAASSNKQKYFSVALRLLEDMRSQNVYMDRMTATSIGVLLVHSSSTYEEAGEAYKHIRSINADGLDEKGFAAVLHAFCTFEPGHASTDAPENSAVEAVFKSKKSGHTILIPPTKLYFEIVQDMQTLGLRKTPQIYTILLSRYAILATRARNIQDPVHRGNIVQHLRDVVKDTHHQISRDAGLQPDAPLFNQLMDAYNRVGLFRDAMQIWTLLNSTGLVTPASVSIIFDTCGYHKESRPAHEIFHDLKERGYQLNRRNWNSWVECLCRLGRLNDAVKVVCSDMARGKVSTIQPDIETLKILLSFASAYGRSDEIRTYLRTHIPDIWNSLHMDRVETRYVP